MPSVVGRPLTECSCRHVAFTIATSCRARRKAIGNVNRIVALS